MDKEEKIGEIYNYNIAISKRLKDICQPLLDHFGIYLITYRKFYNNGDLLYLFNHPDWMRYSFTNQCWNSAGFINRIKDLSTQNCIYYPWPEFPPLNDQVYCALYDFNIWNGMIVYKKSIHSIETFGFASDKNHALSSNFYINNKAIIEHFIKYFKCKIYPIIKPHEKSILIPYKPLVLDQASVHRDAAFFEATKINKFFLSLGSAELVLSKREEECLFHLARGKKTKEIAAALDLSVRTIEFYLNRVLGKTCLPNKSQLIDLYLAQRDV